MGMNQRFIPSYDVIIATLQRATLRSLETRSVEGSRQCRRSAICYASRRRRFIGAHVVASSKKVIAALRARAWLSYKSLIFPFDKSLIHTPTFGQVVVAGNYVLVLIYIEPS